KGIMRFTLSPCHLVTLSAATIVMAGCSSPAPEPAKKPAVKVESRRPRNDAARLVADHLRQATDPAEFRQALDQLSPALEPSEVQARLQLSPAQRTFLQKDVHLSDDEIGEVEATAFRPADGYYLEECSLLRDAAQGLEVPGLSLPEQARLCLRWVGQHVLLHEQGDEWLPNSFILKRGHGGARDRALVFLALMRQFQSGKQSEVGDQPAEGCVLVVPGQEANLALAGIYDDAAQQLYLFDVRRAEPVLKKDGRSIATLKDVQQDPGLLEASGVTQFKDLEAWLVCPLQALAPRVREIERILSTQDRLKLALDPEALQQKLTAALSLPVKVWNAPADARGRAPHSP